MSMDKEKLALGQRFKYLRKRAGLTQKETADALGYLHHSSIFKIENGRQDIDITKIPKICEVFHCSPFELLGLDRNREKPPEVPDFIVRINKLPAAQRRQLENTIDILISGMEAQDGSSDLER